MSLSHDRLCNVHMPSYVFAVVVRFPVIGVYSCSLCATPPCRKFCPWALQALFPIDVTAPNIQNLSTDVQLLASISAKRALIFSRFCFAISLFFAVRSNRSARRHMFTSCLRVVHMPMVFHIKPLAWHSSSAVMISSQPVMRLLESEMRFSILTGETNRHCP